MVKSSLIVQSSLFSAAVMLAACGSSSPSGNQGGSGGGGHGGSSTPASTGGIAGGDGARDAGHTDVAIGSDTGTALDTSSLDSIDGGGGGVPQQCLTSFVNPFAALTPYWANWSNSTCGTAVASNGNLVLTQNEPCGTAAPDVTLGLTEPNVLCGDFDVQVGYALTGFGAAPVGGMFASLRVDDPAAPLTGMTMERYLASYLPSSNSYQNYKSYTDNSGNDATSTLLATSDTTGRLRITRTGTTVTSYYWKVGSTDAGTGEWVLVKTAVLTGTPWVVLLYAGDNSTAGAGPPNYTVTFSNLQVTAPIPTDAGASDASDTAVTGDAVDAPAGGDAVGGTGGSPNTGGSGQGGTTTGGAAGTVGTGGTGGAAGATTCTPTALTDTVFSPSAAAGYVLATDGTNVYWVDAPDNNTERLNRVPVAGGSAVTMAYEVSTVGGLGTYSYIAVDGSNVYFNAYDVLSSVGYGGTGSVLWAIPKGAGPAPQTGGTVMCYSGWSSAGTTTCPYTQYGGTLLTNGGLQASGKYDGTANGDRYGLISTGSEVCFVDGNLTDLRCVPVAGGDPVTLVSVTPNIHRSPIATDGTNVFYKFTATGSPIDVMSVPIAGGTPVKIGSFDSTAIDGGFFLVNGGYIYFSGSGAGQNIVKMPTTGGTPVVVASNQIILGSGFSATDGKNLYWWGQSPNLQPQMMKVSVSGGAPTVLVQDDGTVSANLLEVAVDDASVYWMHPPYMYKCPK